MNRRGKVRNVITKRAKNTPPPLIMKTLMIQSDDKAEPIRHFLWYLGEGEEKHQLGTYVPVWRFDPRQNIGGNY